MFEKFSADIRALIADFQKKTPEGFIDGLRVVADISTEALSLAKSLGISIPGMHADAALESCPSDTVGACLFCCDHVDANKGKMELVLPFGGFFLQLGLKLVAQWIASKIGEPTPAAA